MNKFANALTVLSLTYATVASADAPQEHVPPSPRPATEQELYKFCKEQRPYRDVFGVVGVEDHVNGATFAFLSCAHKTVAPRECEDLIAMRMMVQLVGSIGANDNKENGTRDLSARWESEYGWAIDSYCMTMM